MSSSIVDDVEMKDASGSIAPTSTTTSTSPTPPATATKGANGVAEAATEPKKMVLEEKKSDSKEEEKTNTTTEDDATMSDAEESKSTTKKKQTKKSPSPTRSPKQKKQKKSKDAEEDTEAEAEDEEEGDESTFVSFPPILFPHKDTDYKVLRLPKTWTEPVLSAKKKAAAANGGTPTKKGKDSASSPATKSEEEKAKKREQERREKMKEKEKENLEYNRIIPEAGVTVEESFNKLVNEILHESKPHATSPAALLLPTLTLWEIPHLAHFSWLFQRALHIKPIDPQRFESIITAPNSILNEATFSEFVSKLLFSTRLNYTPRFEKALVFMGRNQRCFSYEVINDWLFWLIEIWIEQWKKLKKQEEEERARQEQEDADAAEGGEDGDEEQSNKKGKKKSKTPVPEQEDSDMSDAEEDEEEQQAFNVHLVPDRKWRVDTMELFENINPFVGEPSTTVAQNGRRSPSGRKSPSAAASAVAASSSADNDEAMTPAEPVLPVRRKSFHELSITHRVTILKLLCDYQIYVNPHFAAAIKDLEATDLRMRPLGSDITGKIYYYFDFPDYRIYVQSHMESVMMPKSTVDSAADKARDEAFAAETERQVAAIQAAAKVEQDKAKAKADKKASTKKAKKAEKNVAIDEDAPLADLLGPAAASSTLPSIDTAEPVDQRSILANWSASPASSSVTPMSSLASSPPPPPTATIKPSTPTATADAAVAAASSTPTAASTAATSSSSSRESELPHKLLPPNQPPPIDRSTIPCLIPSPPLFSLLTINADQMRALIKRLSQIDHERNDDLVRRLKRTVDSLDAGEGRKEEEEEVKGKKKGGDASAPKRVSDRLVTVEAAREMMERERLIRAEENQRTRYTRRNRWLDEQSAKTIEKIKRAYEKSMGIYRAKEKSSDAEEEEEEEDHESDDDYDNERTSSRNTRGSRRTSKASNQRATRTRNGGKSTKSLAENDSETEDEAEEEEYVDSDDEGCEVCHTVIPPSDGSNPILLCDKCDKQLCLKCIPLERVPHGKFFCNECVAANPRIR